MIKINSDYALKRDSYQWILLKKTHTKGDIKKSFRGVVTGEYEEDVWLTESFHNSILQVAGKLINQLDLEDIEDIEELVMAYENLTDTLTKFIESKVNEGEENE